MEIVPKSRGGNRLGREMPQRDIFAAMHEWNAAGDTDCRTSRRVERSRGANVPLDVARCEAGSGTKFEAASAKLAKPGQFSFAPQARRKALGRKALRRSLAPQAAQKKLGGAKLRAGHFVPGEALKWTRFVVLWNLGRSDAGDLHPQWPLAR